MGPSSDPRLTWAPLLAYLLCTDLSSKTEDESKAAIFDRLHLRAAIADALQSLGLDGDQPWRIAARVRLLLSESPSALASEKFWSTPDVRWLAGVNESGGKTYFNQEQLMELASWLQLPALLSVGASQNDLERTSGPTRTAADLAQVTKAASASDYLLATLISNLGPASVKSPSRCAIDAKGKASNAKA